MKKRAMMAAGTFASALALAGCQQEAKAPEPARAPVDTPARYAWKDLSLSDAFQNAQQPETTASPLSARPAEQKPPNPAA